MKIILNNDTARGYFDYNGNECIGVVIASGPKGISEGRYIAKTGDIVHFPYHRTGINTYEETNIPITGSGKMKIQGKSVALEGSILSNGSHLVASGIKLTIG